MKIEKINNLSSLVTISRKTFWRQSDAIRDLKKENKNLKKEVARHVVQSNDIFKLSITLNQERNAAIELLRRWVDVVWYGDSPTDDPREDTIAFIKKIDNAIDP